MPSQVLKQEIGQDEAYQRSGHPILSVTPFVKSLVGEIYELQLRTPPPTTSKGVQNA